MNIHFIYGLPNGMTGEDELMNLADLERIRDADLVVGERDDGEIIVFKQRDPGDELIFTTELY